MKLTLILSVLTVFQLFATETYSQLTKLTLKLEDVKVSDALREIENQSEFFFLYSPKLINVERKVNIDSENETIADILSDIFSGDVKFGVYDRQIILTKSDLTIPSAVVQQLKITGMVTDKDGTPLPGVNVVVTGTTQGVITDNEGKYSVEVPQGSNSLSFSFIGMETQEVTIGTLTQINVTLVDLAIGLEEVVVIGYGTEKRTNLTGAVSYVNSEKIGLDSRPVVNLGQALQGVIPNLNINRGNAAPGTRFNFNIRGLTSITGGGPLILVDGVAMDENLINSSDIQDISVLKDGASTAIYGARAAYGVILITTKQGKRDSPMRISLNHNTSINTPISVPDFNWNSLDFMNFRNEAQINAGMAVRYPQWFFEAVEKYYDNPIPENTVYPGDFLAGMNPNKWTYVGHTDWFKECFNEYATVNNSSASISGGLKNMSYFASAGLMDQGGLMRNFDEKYIRTNFNTKLDFTLTEFLDVSFSSNYNKTERLTPARDMVQGEFWSSQAEPMMPVRNPNGDWAGQGYRNNFVQMQKESGTNSTNINDIWVTGALKLKPFAGMTINFKYSSNYYNGVNKIHGKEFYNYYADGTPPVTNANATKGGYVRQSSDDNIYQVIDLYADYMKDIGKHNFSILAGFNQEDKSFRYFTAYKQGLIVNEFGAINLATGTTTVDGRASEWAIRGAFSRLKYVFNNKYLLEINSRYDGSSRFPKDSRFALFPSVAAAWKIAEEDFFKQLTQEVVNELKVRASYGSLGNQSVASSYPYIPSLGTTAQVGYILNNTRPIGISPAGLVSAGLTWETVNQVNFGLDIGVFKNKFTASFDIYERTTLNMLTAGKPLPTVLGTAVPTENAADLKTNGWELSLGWRDQISKFNYNIGIVLSDNHATITKFDNPSGLISSYYEGMEDGEIWGFVSNGLFQTAEEVANAPSQAKIWGGAWAPGDVRFEDLNGDGIISLGTSTLDNPGDRKIIGNSRPHYTYGIKGGLKWNNFDLDLFLQGVLKRDAWLPPLQFFSFTQQNWIIPPTFQWGNYWKPDNTDAYFPRPILNQNFNNHITTRYLQDGSYLRLKALTLGYTLPETLTARINIDYLRLYFSGENLLTFTKLPKGVDPETLDGSRYFIQRALSFGIVVNL